eukprot:PhM_4_TR17510/c0_g1_i2/m.51081
MIPATFRGRMSPIDAREALVRTLALQAHATRHRATERNINAMGIAAATGAGTSNAHMLSTSNKKKIRSKNKTVTAPPRPNLAEMMVQVRSHIQSQEDRKHSVLEEAARPWHEVFGGAESRTLESYRTTSAESTEDGNIFTFRSFPMYPGEYIPAGHDSLASLRDNLTEDLMAQNLKSAWMRVTKNMGHFDSTEEFYKRADGADEHRLMDIVCALFPAMSPDDARSLVRKVLEAISTESHSTVRVLNRTITAESLGLDNAPQHYTNFLEWMARLMDTVGFKTEHALFQFCRKKFNGYDARLMYENYLLMGRGFQEAARVDGYSHYHTLFRDYIAKITSADSRGQIGVRIDPTEVDLKTGIAVGWGVHKDYHVTALVRENVDGTGKMFVQGEPLNVVFKDQAWTMEMLLQPFDEAGLNFKDFDVYLSADFTVSGPHTKQMTMGKAGRMAISMALTKMMPITRIALKKVGFLSFSRRRPWGTRPGYHNKNKHRFFAKR